MTALLVSVGVEVRRRIGIKGITVYAPLALPVCLEDTLIDKLRMYSQETICFQRGTVLFGHSELRMVVTTWCWLQLAQC